MKKIGEIFHSFLWIIATILEWANIVLFMAAMGYEFDIPIYRDMVHSDYIATMYYVAAGIDIILFGILALINRAKKQDKNMFVAIFCYLVQIALLIYKVKL